MVCLKTQKEKKKSFPIVRFLPPSYESVYSFIASKQNPMAEHSEMELITTVGVFLVSLKVRMEKSDLLLPAIICNQTITTALHVLNIYTRKKTNQRHFAIPSLFLLCKSKTKASTHRSKQQQQQQKTRKVHNKYIEEFTCRFFLQ